jgi:hypothetical protein
MQLRVLLKWGSRIAVQAIYIYIVLYVFGLLHGRLETIVVSLLGVIYATVRSNGIVSEVTLSSLRQAIYEMDLRVRGLAISGFIPDKSEKAAVQDARLKTLVDGAIAGIGLAVASIICLWKLYVTLNP